MTMYYWFLSCVLGMIVVVPVHFLSVEHLKLKERYGERKGARIGNALGLISGLGFFLFWIGIWVSPQPLFTLPFPQNLSIRLPVANFSIPMFHLIIAIPFVTIGAWFGIRGVSELTLRVSETHRAERVTTTGVYSIVRHPQYLGGLLAHLGISFLLCASYSLLSTPLVITLIYLISKKEEEELTKEFGKEYEDYKKRVPMLIPRSKG